MTLQVSVINTRSTSLLGLIKLIRISIRTLLISSFVRIVVVSNEFFVPGTLVVRQGTVSPRQETESLRPPIPLL
jgi:hypothetical protein